MAIMEIVNSTAQTITSGGKIALGNVNIRCGQGDGVYNNVDTITLNKNGIYQIIIKSVMASTVAGQSVGFALAYGGTVSTVANTSETVADAGDSATLTLPKLVKICGNPITLTLVNSGSASTIYNNVVVDIVKVA